MNLIGYLGLPSGTKTVVLFNHKYQFDMGKDSGTIKELKSPSSGTIDPDKGGKDVKMNQPYFSELGLKEDSRVEYNLANLGGGDKEATAVILEGTTQDRAVVFSVNDDNQTGILNYNDAKVRFNQPYCSEIGVNPGVSVSFTSIIVNEQQLAVAVSPADSQRERGH